LKISCINPACHREIPEEEFKLFLTDPALKLKYEKFRQDKLLMLNPNVRFCPRPNCDGYMIGSKTKKKLTCPKCQTNICFNCSQPWHGYFVSCNANVDLGYSRWAINKSVQKCPKCRIAIEKDEGCNHMTCQYCKHQFCWICRGTYSYGHYSTFNIFGCPGAQYATCVRCPACFPRWLNRLLIILFLILVVIPLAIVGGVIVAACACVALPIYLLWHCIEKCRS